MNYVETVIHRLLFRCVLIQEAFVKESNIFRPHLRIFYTIPKVPDCPHKEASNLALHQFKDVVEEVTDTSA